MCHAIVVSDVLSRLSLLVESANATEYEGDQSATFIEAKRCFNVLTSLNELYPRNPYIAEKLADAKTWFASLCVRDDGNARPKADVRLSVLKALDAISGQHGFGIK